VSYPAGTWLIVFPPGDWPVTNVPLLYSSTARAACDRSNDDDDAAAAALTTTTIGRFIVPPPGTCAARSTESSAFERD
jgi:hypothetical protein